MVVHRLEQVTLGVHPSIWLDQKIRGQWERVQKEGYRVYRGRVMERQLAESARLAPSRATASKVMEIDIVLSEHLNISREMPTKPKLFHVFSEHWIFSNDASNDADKVDDVPS
jgi:hypothetical protein